MTESLDPPSLDPPSLDPPSLDPPSLDPPRAEPLTAPAGAPVQVRGRVEPGFEVVAAAFAAGFARGEETGAALAVHHRGRLVVDLWGGQADPQEGCAWGPDTLQVVFSTTKAVTAACALLLVQRGLVDLDAPVAHYWPEFAAAGKAGVPVRWLLTHQAGLPVLDHRLPLSDLLAWDPVVEALARQEPLWEPGTAHGYHAMTFGFLIGEVVRRVTGTTLGAFLREAVAGPLGLDLWIGLPPEHHRRVSRIVEPPAAAAASPATTLALGDALPPALRLLLRAVVLTDPPLDLTDPVTRGAELPSVNGICTARALSRFYAGLLGPVDGVRLLDAPTLAAATTEQAAGPDRILATPTRLGLGFGLPLPDAPWYGPRAFGFPGHGGSLGYADPDTGVAFGYVMNRLDVRQDPDPRTTPVLAALREATAETTARAT